MATFNFTFEPGTSLQQMVGFEVAGRLWEQYLQDDITINIHVEIAKDLPLGVIGGALPGVHANEQYEQFRQQLVSDTPSYQRDAIQQAVQDGETFQAWYDVYVNGSYQGGQATSATLNLSRANAKALGLITADAPSLDGVILLSDLSGTSYRWDDDYTRSMAAPANTLDLLSVAIHEIGHILGFISGVDQPGWLYNFISGQSLPAFDKVMKERIGYATPLDMFRYSPASRDRGLIDISPGGFSGTPSGTKYFAINRWHPIANFAKGVDLQIGGDGYQAGHWQMRYWRSIGIMDPTLAPRERSSISATDLLAFDVIGYDMLPNAANLSPSLAALVTAAKASLANQLNKPVSWLESNPISAAARLAQNRQSDIFAMLKDSQIYEVKRSKDNWKPLVLGMLQNQTIYTSYSSLDELPTVPVTAGDTTSDRLQGDRGNDWLIGLGGADRLAGRARADRLVGNLDGDWLSGGRGDDWLQGGHGSDTLIGGVGQDVFVIEAKRGVDRIKDFQDGIDRLLLAKDLNVEQLQVIQRGSDTWIQQGDRTLAILEQVSADRITMADVLI